MKLVKHYLLQVEFADILQSTAFAIFFILFVSIMIWVLIGPKKMYAENGNMPLEEDDLTDNFDTNNKTQ